MGSPLFNTPRSRTMRACRKPICRTCARSRHSRSAACWWRRRGDVERRRRAVCKCRVRVQGSPFEQLSADQLRTATRYEVVLPITVTTITRKHRLQVSGDFAGVDWTPAAAGRGTARSQARADDASLPLLARCRATEHELADGARHADRRRAGMRLDLSQKNVAGVIARIYSSDRTCQNAVREATRDAGEFCRELTALAPKRHGPHGALVRTDVLDGRIRVRDRLAPWTSRTRASRSIRRIRSSARASCRRSRVSIRRTKKRSRTTRADARRHSRGRGRIRQRARGADT
jgi:hypothetical protein